MVKKILTWVAEHKEHVATISLIVGFFVDVVTFRSINLFVSELILSVNLVIVAGSILILSMPTRETKTFFAKVRSWIPIAQQYSMGNLLSAFLILYSASGSIIASWPFLLLVAVAAIGNEVIKLQKYRLPFQTTLFFMNLLLFAALALPIAVNRIGATTFVLSIVSASAVFAAFVWIGRIITRVPFKAHWHLIRAGWVAVTVLMLVLYFTNLIPPIPLSVKASGVYHSVERSNGEYQTLREVRTAWERFLDLNGETLHLTSGEDAYVFTAIFAPAHFSENIVHRWQFLNEESGEWETKNTVRFPILGGRQGGYRGYSLMENPAVGRWRMSVETVRGQVIGQTYFSVERVTKPVVTELYTY